MDELITAEYWPNTASWRILVAGIAVGYWPTEEEATRRAREARQELRKRIAAAEQPSPQSRAANEDRAALDAITRAAAAADLFDD